jgi:choline-glycine betaine transporter
MGPSLLVSADSATLIVDSLALQNGRKNRHWTRRTFWAIMIGALATTLLSSSGSVDALTAVQSIASVVCGLPVAVIMCYLIQSVTLLCRAAEKQDCGTDYCFPKQPEFKVSVYGGMFNALEVAASFWRVSNSPTSTRYAISALVAWRWLLSYAVILSLLFGVSF